MTLSRTGLLLLLIFAGCVSVPTELNLPSQTLDAPPAAGLNRVIFYNDSPRGPISEGRTIGIKIDGKGVTALAPGRYVRIDLAPARHHLELSHADTLTFSDEYSLQVAADPLYVRLYRATLSASYEINRTPPVDFSRRFRPR